MRAAWYTKQGSAGDVIAVGELEVPEPGPGEVRVRVHASGVNPVDVKRRAGGRGDMEPDLVVPHFDGAGTIDAVGPDVDQSRVGERVWVYEAQWGSDFGTAADYVTIPSERAVELPDSTSFVEGACLGIPALTAYQCVFGDGPVDGGTVLVTGGAGAVGSYAAQFASLSGARVIATVSSEEKAALAKQCRADVTIDYRREDVAARVLEETGGEGVDRIVEVEFGGNLPTSLEVLKRDGVIATYASEASPEPAIPFYSMLYKNIAVRFELVFLMPEENKRRAAVDLTRWMAAGDLVHRVAETLPLEGTARAHEAVEAGAFGKVVVSVTD